MDRNMTVNVFRSVPLFAALTAREREALAGLVQTTQLTRGDVLCRQGDVACSFSIVREGELRRERGDGASLLGVLAPNPADPVRSGAHTESGRLQVTLSITDYFGDKQLLAARIPCEHTIKVSSARATVLALDKEQFEAIVGSVSSYLRRMDAGVIAALGLPRALRHADSVRLASDDSIELSDDAWRAAARASKRE